MLDGRESIAVLSIKGLTTQLQTNNFTDNTFFSGAAFCKVRTLEFNSKLLFLRVVVRTFEFVSLCMTNHWKVAVMILFSGSFCSSSPKFCWFSYSLCVTFYAKKRKKEVIQNLYDKGNLEEENILYFLVFC